MTKRRPELRIDGPVIPRSGNVYRVNYNDGRTSNAASASVCIAVARKYNKASPKHLAWVEYIEETGCRDGKD